MLLNNDQKTFILLYNKHIKLNLIIKTYFKLIEVITIITKYKIVLGTF